MHDVAVNVVSTLEAGDQIAEFWLAGELLGITRLIDGELVLSIEPRRDGQAVLVGAHSLAAALVDARELLSDR